MKAVTMIYMAVALSASLSIGVLVAFFWSERRARERERWLRDRCTPSFEATDGSSAPADESQERLIPIHRRPFHEALWEDEPDLAPSPRARAIAHGRGSTKEPALRDHSAQMTTTDSEDEEMRKVTAVIALAGAGAVAACGMDSTAPERSMAVSPNRASIEAALEEGMAYGDFRRLALSTGWKPSGSNECLLLTVGDNYKSECLRDSNQRSCVVCSKFPELDACSYDGYCYMTFSMGAKSVHVTTYGEILDADTKINGNPAFVTKWNISEM